MRRIHIALGLAVTLAAGGLAAPARAQTLAVNTGLWEVEMLGGPPGGAMPEIPADQLAKMTPQMREMIQQRMAALAQQQNGKHKFCLTQAMLDRGFNPSSEAQHHCQRTPVSTSSTEMTFKMECNATFKASGTVHVSVLDRENMQTVVDMEVTRPGGAEMPMHREMKSHWLGSDCGDVKPPAQYQ